MVDVDRLVAVELEPPVDLLSVEGLRFLLCHADEDDLIMHSTLPAEIVGDVVLPFLVVELLNRNLLWLGLRFYRRIGLPSCCCMNVTSPPEVASLPMYPFKYSRSRHSTSSVT